MSASDNNQQLTFDLGYITSHGLADFIVTDANRLAFDHINSFPQWSGPMTLITGPEKSGKTHLAQIWATKSDADFLIPENIEDASQRGGQNPVVLEDVDRVGFEERALFHLLNQSMRDERPVLMSARRPVVSWPFATDDVKSRARLAAHFNVMATDDLALCQMFAKLFDDRQVVVDPSTITYLVARMERSPGEVFALAHLLDDLALKRGRAISRKIAAEALVLRLETDELGD